VKHILERFEKAYTAAETRGKREYDRGALDVYGGIERLRRMEWLCVESFHWTPEPTLYVGFRGYLEHFVEEAVKKADGLHKSESEDESAEKEVVEQGSRPETEVGRKRKRN
jgi:hypothetical protein